MKAPKTPIECHARVFRATAQRLANEAAACGLTPAEYVLGRAALLADAQDARLALDEYVLRCVEGVPLGAEPLLFAREESLA